MGLEKTEMVLILDQVDVDISDEAYIIIQYQFYIYFTFGWVYSHFSYEWGFGV